MSKATTWTAQRPKSLDWDNVKATVDARGQAEISNGRLGMVVWLAPREAYALGKWLIDTFGDA